MRFKTNSQRCRRKPAACRSTNGNFAKTSFTEHFGSLTLACCDALLAGISTWNSDGPRSSPDSSGARAALSTWRSTRNARRHDSAGVAGVNALVQDLDVAAVPVTMPRKRRRAPHLVVVASSPNRGRSTRFGRADALGFRCIDVERQVEAAALFTGFDQDRRSESAAMPCSRAAHSIAVIEANAA